MSRASDAERFDVWLQDRTIGHLDRRGDVTRFSFADGFLDAPGRPVLGLRFEDTAERELRAKLRLPSWFSNLLPEGVLREWIAADSGVSPQREMELLARVGHDLPGAVRITAADRPPDELEDDQQAGAGTGVPGDPRRWRFSLAGVALKFSMLRTGDRFTGTAVGRRGRWIVKLPDAHYPDVPINEYTMMRYAAAVGIEVPEVALVHRDLVEDVPDELWPGGQEYAYAVRRFDRAEDDRLVHIEDFAQVRGFYPESKYQGGYQTVAALIHRGHDESALAEFVRRLVFFILIGNGDAHLKNWSLIYRDPRRPTLSPVYDVVSTLLYAPAGEPEDLALSFFGDRDFAAIKLDHLRRLGTRLGAGTDLVEVAEQTIDQALAHLPQVIDELASVPRLQVAIDASVRDRAQSLRR